MMWRKGNLSLLRMLTNPSYAITPPPQYRFNDVLQTVEEADIDSPKASSHLGNLIGQAVLDEILPLSFLGRALDHLIPSGKALKIASEAFRVLANRTVHRLCFAGFSHISSDGLCVCRRSLPPKEPGRIGHHVQGVRARFHAFPSRGEP